VPPGRRPTGSPRAFSEDAAAAKIKKLERSLDQARAMAAEPWNERVKGALLKAQAAEAAISSYAATNLQALMEEQEPFATDLHTRQVAALQTVVDIERERSLFVRKLSEIERAAGQPPSIPDRQMPLYREARRALDTGVPRIDWPHRRLRTAEEDEVRERLDAGDGSLVQEVTW
jgi:hypothetical protein